LIEIRRNPIAFGSFTPAESRLDLVARDRTSRFRSRLG
jgi:hypothetical protein